MDPPERIIQLAIAAAPALIAVFFAVVKAAVGSLGDARKTALLESLNGGAQQALSRYVNASMAIEGRWRVFRVLGLALSALFFARAVPESPILGALGGILIVFALPAEIASACVRRRPEITVPMLLRLAQPIEWLVYPLAAPITAVGRLVSNGVQQSQAPDSGVTETELEILVNQGERDGSLEHDESEMLRNVLDFGDIRVGDVMVPRTRVTAVEKSKPLSAILELMESDGHSRYPVYDDGIDNIVGIVHVKDALTRTLTSGVGGVRIGEIMRTPVMYVPQTQSASSVLGDMRAGRRAHMAVVIDEFGGMSGIVTLEDLLEEIVGDIRDEHDREEPGIVALDEDRWLVDASMPIADVSRELGIELPDDGDYNSLGGMLVEAVGCVPKPGGTHVHDGLEFLVREADERRVKRVEVSRLDRASKPAA